MGFLYVCVCKLPTIVHKDRVLVCPFFLSIDLAGLRKLSLASKAYLGCKRCAYLTLACRVEAFPLFYETPSPLISYKMNFPLQKDATGLLNLTRLSPADAISCTTILYHLNQKPLSSNGIICLFKHNESPFSGKGTVKTVH